MAFTSYTSPNDFWENVGVIATGPRGDTANQIAVPISDTDIEMGMLCSLNTSGKAVKGLDDDACMGLWSMTMNDEQAYDYWNSGLYADTSIGEAQGIGGKINLLAGNGGCMIFTNAYKSGQTYTAGRTMLTNCTTAADTAANLGKVKPADGYYNDAAVVGVVGVAPGYNTGAAADLQNASSRNVLYIWPVYMPPVMAASTDT